MVIFDCDGVLVDSETLAGASATEMLREAGVPVTLDEVMSYVGVSDKDMFADLRRRHGVTMPGGFAARCAARIEAAFDEALQPVPGIAAFVSGLREPCCVASSSSLPRIRRSLGTTGLLPLFGDRIFSADMVARGKPAPDLFLHAARTLGEKPESCVVVEDSPYGVKAAVAAGMAVIGFTGGSHCGPATSRALQAAGAGVVAASAEDVSKAYRSIARR